MADIPTFAPSREDMVQALWYDVTGRWQAGYYFISGGCANELGSPGMAIQIDEILTIYGTTAASASTAIDAHHDTLARIDVLCVDTGGAFYIHKGDNLAIDDPLGNYNPTTHANWTQLQSPYPKAGVPAGYIPLYEIFVGPAVTAIYDEDLFAIAAKGPRPPTIASAGTGVSVYGPVRITHDGGASQAIQTTPALCEIEAVIVKCAQAPDTATMNIGWAGDTDALMANSEIPILLNGVAAIRNPVSEITSATAIIATVGGAGSIGEWDVWLKITEYSAS